MHPPLTHVRTHTPVQYRICDDIVFALMDESSMQTFCSNIMPIITSLKLTDNNQAAFTRSVTKVLSGGDFEMAIYNDTACLYLVKVGFDDSSSSFYLKFGV